jgi:hypothetical protein
MKRISFNQRFVNEAGNDLISGKIHTIRQNYEYWKKFEGQEVALFTWEGKPYQKGSKQKVFCVKRIVSVQEVIKRSWATAVYKADNFRMIVNFANGKGKFIIAEDMAHNDGFKNKYEFRDWFNKPEYKPGKMAILHFTDFRY